MSEHAQPRTGTHGTPGSTGSTLPPRDRAVAGSRSAGWIWFAGSIMVLAGLFNVIEGLVALFHGQYYLVGPNGLLVFDLRGWGWIHLRRSNTSKPFGPTR